MENQIIYTVGHSTHQLDYFLELIKEYKINCIVDVRSSPASSYNPQYNQEPFKNYLKSNGVMYLHFPEEFGARQRDPDLLDDEGKLDFEKFRKTWAFNHGLERIWKGIEKGYNIAIMCSESEPLDCHRFSMVSVGLKNDGFLVKHIYKDKTIKSQEELEEELLKRYEKKLPQKNLFEPDITTEQQLKAAYKLKNKEIGFMPFSNNKQEDNHD